MTDRLIARRDVLRTGLAALTGAGFARTGWSAGAEEGGKALRFRLKETAGLRRFGYPVHTLLPVPPGETRFRLERDGKAVPAQFRAVDGPDGRKAVALDFNASPGPLETEVYTIVSGPGIEPGPEPKRGMRVAQVGEEFQVSNGTALVYRLPRTIRLSRYAFRRRVPDPSNPVERELAKEIQASPPTPVIATDEDRGVTLSIPWFLLGVTNAGLAFAPGTQEALLGHGLAELSDTKAGGSSREHEATDFRGAITQEGPLAVGLRFEGLRKKDGTPRSTLELTFPSSKSWVEVTWSVDDPEGAVSEFNVTQTLRTEGEPILVDLGASNTVYGHLRKQEGMSLVAGDAPGLPPLKSAWVVRQETGSKVAPFATAPQGNAAPAEGWAHVMDRTRCTAVSVADFGHAARDTIGVRGNGLLALTRRFAGDKASPPRSRKTLRFWMHFVPMPVQVGAVTSPQAMLAPLEVAFEPEGG